MYVKTALRCICCCCCFWIYLLSSWWWIDYTNICFSTMWINIERAIDQEIFSVEQWFYYLYFEIEKLIEICKNCKMSRVMPKIHSLREINFISFHQLNGASLQQTIVSLLFPLKYLCFPKELFEAKGAAWCSY